MAAILDAILNCKEHPAMTMEQHSKFDFNYSPQQNSAFTWLQSTVGLFIDTPQVLHFRAISHDFFHIKIWDKAKYAPDHHGSKK